MTGIFPQATTPLSLHGGLIDSLGELFLWPQLIRKCPSYITEPQIPDVLNNNYAKPPSCYCAISLGLYLLSES